MAGARSNSALPSWLPGLVVLAWLAWLPVAWCSPPLKPAEQAARVAYAKARQAHHSAPESSVAAWQFGRACFDLAEYVTARRERAQLAEEGIKACEESLRLGPDTAAARYYLGMNLGQLARTRGFSALKLVSRLRREFEATRTLDPTFDNAGPDRNLGYVFRDTPVWTGIGDRKKAEFHLTQAVKLGPDYPENWIALIEGRLDWGSLDKAREEMKTLEKLLPDARKQLTGPYWDVSWYDWNERLRKVRKKLGYD